ncbi:MAG: S8 family serine peptidase [Sulfuricellaceae bacterium]
MMNYVESKNKFLQLISLFIMSATYISIAWAETTIVPTEILVKYKENASLSKTGRIIGHGVVAISVSNYQSAVSRSGNEFRLNKRLNELHADPSVEYAEPNYLGHFEDMPPAVATPNDPGYSSQWWLDTVGARQAWAIASGKGLTIAVIDSGVDMNHPDLKPNLRSDGYNFGDGNALPQDSLGHGTFVAGITAAQCGNARAGCGLAPDVRLLPIKINASASSTFDSATLAQGIDYAVTHGAKIINLSISVDNATQTVGKAIQRALDAGIVVVAAAGNEGGIVSFPGTYPGVITVAGTNRDGTLWNQSNRGKEVTIAAPASDVYSTLIGGGFGLHGQGTSYATPMVAAAVASILQINGRLDSKQVAALLAENSHELATKGQNFGILDAGKSLLALLPNLIPDKRHYKNGESLRLDYRLPLTGGPVDIYVAITTPTDELSLTPDGKWIFSATTGYLVTGSAYNATASATETLFGKNGIFPAIEINNIPSGRYIWKTVLVERNSDSTIGPIIESPVTVTVE